MNAALPHTWRPRRGRIVCYTISAILLTVTAVIALLLPHEGAFVFSIGDRIGVFAFALGISWFLHRHASVKLVAQQDGLLVVNLFRRRMLSWGEVLAVRLRPGDPWAFLDLSDGETLAAMGIQASDGPAAVTSARELARLVRALTPDQPGSHR
jgi:Bacterial PH domain